MMGNSGNTDSRIESSRSTQLGPTVRNFHFSFMNFHLFSHNNHSLNRTFKHNSTKVLFAVVCILALNYLNSDKKHQLKVSCK